MPDLLPSTDPVSPPKSLRWWLQAVQVRFRFLIIVCVAALVVSQWQHVEQVWDRVVWRMTGSSGSAVAGGHEYFCPMDPGVLSAWPAICPICNMDLVPRAHTDAQILPEGVVARMQLSPYRLQLAGVRTTQVKPREMSCTLNYSGLTTSPLDAQDEPLSIDLTIPVSLRDADLLRLSTASRVTVREADSLAAAFEISEFKYQIKEDSPLPQLHLQLSGPHAIASGVAVQVAIDVLFADSSGTQMLAVPETAVIHRGDQHLVYVETMPGMYDGVSVTLGRRCGDRKSVV